MAEPFEKILIYGNPILRKRTEPVEDFDSQLSEFVERMVETMFEKNGIGLAAPQVGELSNIIVVDKSFGEKVDDYLVLINPEVMDSSGECTIQEGCLSVPGIYEDLVRPEKARVRYRNVDGLEHEADMDGMLARIVQHEIDHLDGVLFVDRLSSVKRSLLANSLKSMAEENAKV